MKNSIIPLLILVFFINISAQTDRSAKEAKGLAVGDRAPLFKALDADSNYFVLEQSLIKGPVVLIFYRGHWCPVCNQHLGILQDSLKYIEERGARVVAVSPEIPEFLNKMEGQTGASFNLLYDEGSKIADAYGVSFKPSSFKVFTYNVFAGAKMKEAHDNEVQILPIPATYIINSEGIIIWRQFDPDYKKRSSVKDIISALDN